MNRRFFATLVVSGFVCLHALYFHGKKGVILDRTSTTTCRGCMGRHRRQKPVWPRVRGAGVKAGSPAQRGRSEATRLDAGEHTRTLLAWRCRRRTQHLAVDRSPVSIRSSRAPTLDGDFDIYGVRRRTVARYDEHGRRLDNTSGFIDLFWPDVLLGRAEERRTRPDSRTRSGRHVLRRVVRTRPPPLPASLRLPDVRASRPKASGYDGDDLERFLVRTVFCLFANYAGIFEPRGMFLQFIEERTPPAARISAPGWHGSSRR